MNKFSLIKTGVLLSAFAISFTACVHDDDFSIPPIGCNQTWVANTTVEQAKALNTGDAPMLIETDTVIEGYVVSSDENGNIYKSIVIQDNPSTPTAGMSVELELANSYTYFPVGSKVMINAKGLYIGKSKGTYKIGGLYKGQVGKMTELEALNKVAKTCDAAVEITPTTFTRFEEDKKNKNVDFAKKESNINTLVKLEGVQFETVGDNIKFYDEKEDPNGYKALNRILIDKYGKKLTVRTSKFAKFSAAELPKGSGSIVGVLSAYASNNKVTPSSYQLTILNIEDVKMDGERFVPVKDDAPKNGGPVGGASAQFNSCLNLNFDANLKGQNNFPEYLNIAQVGSRYWQVAEYGGAKYLQLSAYTSGGEVEAYFVVPVNFDVADGFSFKSKDGYNKGDVLKVYYSPDYTVGGQLNIDSLVDITSNFIISTGNTNKYGDDFVDSGVYSLASHTGNGAIVFGYKGKDGEITTTMQIDDIRVIDNENASCN